MTKKNKIHLIGIGGIGMSALAQHLHAAGVQVSGSDLKSSELTDRLQELGIPIIIGDQKPENIPQDLEEIVMTTDISEENPELIEAKSRGLIIKTYPEKVGEIIKDKKGIAVSGTNGKTTTTGMIAQVLVEAGRDPSYIIGSKLAGTNARIGKSNLFLIEACEHKAAFLSYRPLLSIVTNIEADHLDYYRDLDHIIKTFQKFFSQINKNGALIVNADDPGSQKAIQGYNDRLITYGIENEADFIAYDLELLPTITKFKVKVGKPEEDKETLGQFTLRVSGKHNIYNALATIACAQELGVPIEKTKKALGDFAGTWRRFDEKGVFNGITIIEDYAHHPTSVKVTLQAAKQKYPGKRIVAVFQPHHQIRLEALFDDFATSFSEADIAYLVDVFQVAGRTGGNKNIDSAKLARACKKKSKTTCIYSGNIDETVNILDESTEPGDILLIMGAGDVTEITEKLISRLKKKASS